MHSQRYKRFLTCLALAGVYYLSGKMGLALAFIYPTATTIWPPSGIALAALLLLGWRCLPGIALGALLVNLGIGNPWPVALGIAAGNALEALTAYLLLIRVCRFRNPMERMRDVLALVFPAALGATLVSAVLGPLCLGLGGDMAWSQYFDVLLIWWVGDGLGILVVTPFLLTWARRPFWPTQPRERLELITLVGMVTLLALLVFELPSLFEHWPKLQPIYLYTLSYALFALLIWIAIRHRPREIGLLNLILAGIAVWGTVCGMGPFATASTAQSMLLLQGFLAVMVVTSLSLAAANSERLHTEWRLLASEQRFRDVVNAAGEYVWEVDGDLRYRYLSERVETALGYPPQALLGRQPLDLVPAAERQQLRDWLGELRRRGWGSASLELRMLRGDGELAWQRLSAMPIRGAGNEVVGLRGTGLDITERKRAQDHIERLATRDPLTGLANRPLLLDRLQHAIHAARRKRRRLALLCIDLDRFKTINDSLGHPIGDELLKAVALRLQDCLSQEDSVARLGGDEFVVILEEMHSVADAGLLARRLLAAVDRPYQVDGHTLNSTCSIGISLYPNDGEDGQTLLRNADAALYHAKGLGRNNYQFFSPQLSERALERLRLENDLRLALERGEFELWYQPQRELESGRLVAAEALLRWHHPERGLLAPGVFMAIAEETGLIQPIGEWVLRQACHQQRQWSEQGFDWLRLAVNLSVVQFNGALEQRVQAALRDSGADPRRLEFEIIESALLQNTGENIRILRRLSALGSGLAIDDFGTGYSALSYLKRFPIDALKIDRSFVRDLRVSADDAAIIGAIIALAHSLDLRVVAEGVETQEQLHKLRELGCCDGQGHLLGGACPAAEFTQRFLSTMAVEHEVARSAPSPR
ncbi:MAG TPA: EAL domain-containing protein [Candidatus Competibacteraceae bacterium]|nr:EAL domain-containing protein [Candidatus Competibacteraceae bacterium]